MTDIAPTPSDLDPRMAALFRRFSRIAAAVVLALGTGTYLAWSINLPHFLPRLIPASPPMAQGTSFGFAICAASLLLQQGSPRQRRVGKLVALLALFWVSDVLFDYLAGESLSEPFLYRLPGGGPPGFPPSPEAAGAFILVSLALLLYDLRATAGKCLQACVLLAIAVPLIALLGYLTGEPMLFSIFARTTAVGMAIHTGVVFLVLCLAILASRPERGLIAFLASAGEGGMLARQLLAVIILLPLALGPLSSSIRSAGFGEPFLVSFSILFTISVFATFTGFAARRLRRSEFARKEAEERIADLQRMREEWTSVIAHDLRQPVAAIRLNADLLRKTNRDALQCPQALDRIGTCARNLDRMIGDLLDVSRIESKRLQLQPERIELEGLLRELVDKMGYSKERAVEIDCEKGPCAAWADPLRLEQVLSNLISNAIKYGEPGTPVRLRIRGTAAGPEVSVTNQGAGISAEELPRLFSRFTRSEASKHSKVPGLGLGLYITKGILEAHGGTIRVESVPGKETTFTFTLPGARTMRKAA